MNKNSIFEEIKSRAKSGNVCCHSVQNLLTSSLLSKNIKIKVQKNAILPVDLCGYDTWPITLREKRRLGVSTNRVSRKTFEPKD